MKRSSLNWVMIVSVFALIVIGAYFGGLFSTVGTPEAGKYYEAPVFGYLACEEADAQLTTPTKTFSYTTVECQEAGSLTQGCTVNFQMPTVSEADKAYSYLCIAVLNQGQPVPSGTRCTPYFAKEAFFGAKYAGQTIPITISKDQYIDAQYIEGGIFSGIFGQDTVSKGKYSITFRPFQIYRYDVFSLANGAAIPNTADCTFTGDISATNAIVDSISSNKLASQYSQYAVGVDSLRDPGRRVAFLSKFVTVPAGQFELIGQNLYCQDKRVYEVTQIETSLGTYNVVDVGVDNFVKQVECCNDADAIITRGPNYYCDGNQKIQQYSSDAIECSAFDACPMVGYVPGVDGKMYFQECINNQCVTDSIKVACISNSDCPSGSYCDADALNPKNNKCVATILIDKCGNGICETGFGETAQNCPSDCSPSKGKGGIPNWLVYTVLGLAILTLAVAIVRRKK